MKVTAVFEKSGTLTGTTPADSTGAFLKGKPCVQAEIANAGTVNLEFKTVESEGWFPIFPNSYFSVFGIKNTNQIKIRSADSTAQDYAVRWEA